MVADKVRQFLCKTFSGGHEDLLRIGINRLSLVCSCGHETAGWDLRSDTKSTASIQNVKALARVVSFPGSAHGDLARRATR